jgi:hypothetical protein
MKIELSGSELQLITTGLKVLLEAEDDPEEIKRLKLLLARLPQRKA